MNHHLFVPVWSLAAMFVFWGIVIAENAMAENEGLPELDQATELKLSARRLDDLEKIVDLCETALEKGLDEKNTEFAKRLAASTLYQRAEQFCQPIFGQARPDGRWAFFREIAMRDLKRAARFDDQLGDVHLLRAKLLLLPGGDQKEARKAATEAVDAFAEDRARAAEALLLRATLQEDDAKQLADLNRAVQLDPENADVLRTRGIFHLQAGSPEKAEEDFRKLLTGDADDVTLRRAMAEALIAQEKTDEALEQVEKAMEVQADDAANFLLRAKIRALKEDMKGALEDADAALEIAPRSGTALKLRARLRHADGQTQKAIGDVTRALQLDPDDADALHLRALLYAAEADLPGAIADLEKLVELRPDRIDWHLQLAALYVSDNRPRKAIETYTEILEKAPDNASALRGRGDARLNIGDHEKAIKDLEAAYQQSPDNDGILNNLAWVLATSPVDKLRDGKRAIELATRAAELTNYQEAHILSTLASAYAETGDFETAIKWSSKAVQLGQGEIKEQLQQELQSYQDKKPWREMQQTKEKPASERKREVFDL